MSWRACQIHDPYARGKLACDLSDQGTKVGRNCRIVLENQAPPRASGADTLRGSEMTEVATEFTIRQRSAAGSDGLLVGIWNPALMSRDPALYGADTLEGQIRSVQPIPHSGKAVGRTIKVDQEYRQFHFGLQTG